MSGDRVVTYACEDCGAETTRRRRPGEPEICLPCGIERQLESGRQMAAKSGPLYERWVARMREATSRLEGEAS